MRSGRRRAALEAYLQRRDELTEAFLRAKGMFDKAPTAAQKAAGIARLRRLHAGFKNLACPDEALSEHWAASEAMRHDLAAREGLPGTRRASTHAALAASYWERAS